MSSFLTTVLKEKCPYCEKGDVFKPGKHLPFQAPRMNSHCPNCHRFLEGEPGYFFGAMYVSYGLGVGQGIILFLLCRYLLNIESWNLIIGILGFFIIALSNKNMRWARIIWLKVFPHSV